MIDFEKHYHEEDFVVFLLKVYEIFERLKYIENRVGSNEELKEADTLRYFTKELQAAKVCFFNCLLGMWNII